VVSCRCQNNKLKVVALSKLKMDCRCRKLSLFFCKFLSAVGVLEQDCLYIFCNFGAMSLVAKTPWKASPMYHGQHQTVPDGLITLAPSLLAVFLSHNASSDKHDGTSSNVAVFICCKIVVSSLFFASCWLFCFRKGTTKFLTTCFKYSAVKLWSLFTFCGQKFEQRKFSQGSHVLGDV